MNPSESHKALRLRMAGSFEASGWNEFLRYARTAMPEEFAELDAAADTVADIDRTAPGEWYGLWEEIDTGDREGPALEFRGLCPEPDARFRFARALCYGGDLQALAVWPHLAQIRSLSLHSLHNPKGLIELLDSQNASNVTHLSLNFLPMDDPALTRSLLALPLFRRLKGMTLSWCRSDNAQVFRPWFDALAAAKIDFLHIEHCDLRTEGIRHLRDSGVLRNVQDLSLRGVYMGPAESRILAEFHGPFALSRLEIEDSAFDNGGFEMAPEDFARFVRAPLCQGLRSFTSRYHNAGSQGMKAMAESGLRRTLTQLSLQNAAIGNEGMRALLAADWPNLKYFRITYDLFTPEIKAEIESWPVFARLAYAYVDSLKGLRVSRGSA